MTLEEGQAGELGIRFDMRRQIPLLIIFLPLACGSPKADAPPKSSNRQESPVELKLEAITLKGRRELAVKVSATNIGKEVVTWDRDFSTYIKWTVIPDEGPELKTVHVSNVERPSADAFKLRFIALGPGETVSKEIELTKAIESFVHGSALVNFQEGKPIHSPIGYEEVVRFDLPVSCHYVHLQAGYDRGSGSGAGFLYWFGTEKETKMPEGTIRSNAIEIRLE
jgi:hypothetical protein